MGCLSPVPRPLSRLHRDGTADQMVLYDAGHRVHLHAYANGHRRRPQDRSPKGPLALPRPRRHLHDRCRNVLLLSLRRHPVRPAVYPVQPQRRLLHAYHRPGELRGLQCIGQRRHGPCEEFPAHPRLRYGRFYLQHAAHQLPAHRRRPDAGQLHPAPFVRHPLAGALRLCPHDAALRDQQELRFRLVGRSIWP